MRRLAVGNLEIKSTGGRLTSLGIDPETTQRLPSFSAEKSTVRSRDLRPN